MKKLFNGALLMLLALVVVILTACSGNATENKGNTNQNVTEEKIILGFVQSGSEGGWRLANTESIINEAAAAGIELVFKNAEGDKDTQIEYVREMITQNVDVISFSPIVVDGWEDVLKEAKEANIPVIITDRGLELEDTSLYVSLIGADFKEEGEKAGQWLLERVKDTAEEVKVFELEGLTGSAPAIERKDGFDSVVAANKNIKIIDSVPGDFVRAKGKEVMANALTKYNKDIDVVFAHNDEMAAGAAEAIEEAGLKPAEDIIIISVDATKLGFEEMIAGRINVCVECNPLLGSDLMNTVKDLMSGKEVEKRIVPAEGVFPMETAAEILPSRKY